jgi:hypothetical protein
MADHDSQTTPDDGGGMRPAMPLSPFISKVSRTLNDLFDYAIQGVKTAALARMAS